MRNRYGLQRNIPDSVARQIRQRCGFGCVICGDPFIYYHHFDPPFNQAREHRAEGITILCGNHHREADHGRRSIESIKARDADPECRRRGHTVAVLDGSTGPLKFIMGSAVFDTPVILMYETIELISFRPPETNEAPWRLSARIFDRIGRELLRITDNEWRIDTNRYDVTAEGKVIEVRQRKGDVVLAMDLVVDGLIHIRRLQMQCFEVDLVCDELSFSVKNRSGGLVRFVKPPGSNNLISGDIGIRVLPSMKIVEIATSLLPGSSAGVAMILHDS